MYGDGGLSDFIKQILDLGTKILKFADSPMGKFVITMGEVLVVMKAFKMLMGNGLVSSIKGFVNILAVDGVKGLRAYNAELVKVQASGKELTKSQSALAGLKGGLIGLGVTLGVEGLILGLEKLNELKNEDYNNSIKAIEKSEEEVQELNNEISTLESLSEKLKNAKGDRSKLASIYTELNDAIGVSVGLINGEETAYDETNKKIQDRITLNESLIRQQKDLKIQKSEEAFSSYSPDQSGFGHELSRIDMNTITNMTKGKTNGSMELGAISSYADDISGKIGQELIDGIDNYMTNEVGKEDWENTINELLKQAKVFTEDIVSSNAESLLSNSTFVDTFIKSLIKRGVSDPEAIKSELSKVLGDAELGKLQEEFYASFEDGSNLNTTDIYRKLSERLITLTKNGGDDLKKSVDSILETYLKSMGVASGKIADATKKLITPLEDISISSIIDDVSDQFDALSKAQDEMSDSGVLSGSTIKSLIASFPEVEDSLVATANGYTINKEKLDELNNSLLYKYELARTTAIKEANEIVNAQNTEAQAYAGTTAEVKKLLQAKMALLTADISQQQQLSVTNQVTDSKFSNILGNKLGGGTGAIAKNIAGENAKALQNQLNQLQQALANIDTAEKTYNKAQTAISSLGSSSASKSSSSGSSSSTEDMWKKSFEEKQATLKYNLDMNYTTEKQYYDDLAYLNEVYFAGRNEYLDEYRDNLVEVYQGQKKLQEQAVDDIETLRDMIVDMLKSQTEEKIKSLEAERDKLDDIYELRKKALEVLKEENEYQEQLAESNKTVADIESELQAVKLDTSREGIAKRLQLEEELAKATEDRDKLVKDKQYENSIDAIEKEKDASDKYFEDKITQLQLYLDNQGLLIDDANAKMRNANADLYNQLLAWNKSYGDGISSTISNAWNSALNALNNYKSQANQVLGSSYSVGATYTPTMSPSATQYYQQQAQAQYDSYTVKKGDTLWALAQRYYSDATKWTKIQSANGGIDPYSLRIGSTLKIPKYAKGTLGVGENQIARINELGDELVVRANGQGDFTSLTKGSGVIPSNLTKNLMEWGKMNPNAVSQLSNSDNSSISIGDIIINGSSNLTRDDLDKFRKTIVSTVMDNIQHNKSKIGVKNNVFNLS